MYSVTGDLCLIQRKVFGAMVAEWCLWHCALTEYSHRIAVAWEEMSFRAVYSIHNCHRTIIYLVRVPDRFPGYPKP